MYRCMLIFFFRMTGAQGLPKNPTESKKLVDKMSRLYDQLDPDSPTCDQGIFSSLEEYKGRLREWMRVAYFLNEAHWRKHMIRNDLIDVLGQVCMVLMLCCYCCCLFDVCCCWVVGGCHVIFFWFLWFFLVGWKLRSATTSYWTYESREFDSPKISQRKNHDIQHLQQHLPQSHRPATAEPHWRTVKTNWLGNLSKNIRHTLPTSSDIKRLLVLVLLLFDPKSKTLLHWKNLVLLLSEQQEA